MIGQLGFVLSVGTFIGVQPSVMVEEVPASIRCTAIALGYNITLGIIGGLTRRSATGWSSNRKRSRPGLHGDGRGGRVVPLGSLFKENSRAVLQMA